VLCQLRRPIYYCWTPLARVGKGPGRYTPYGTLSPFQEIVELISEGKIHINSVPQPIHYNHIHVHYIFL
jgi:hypothetical protein